VFFICVMVILAGGYSAYAAALVIVFAAIVKLFPIFGITILLKESKNKFWWLFTGCLLVLLIYMAATWDSVKASWNLTMRGDGASYGTNVFVTRYGPAISQVFSVWFSNHRIELLLKYGPLAMALVLLLIIGILAIQDREKTAFLSERNMAAFRMGASVYVGTFLLGNNFDYRLAFLVLVIPQLVEWIFSTSKKYRALALFSMFAIMVSCWHFWISTISLVSLVHSVEDSGKYWIILDEAFNWMLYASLAYLLVVSIPDWLKDQLGSLLSKRNIVSPTR